MKQRALAHPAPEDDAALAQQLYARAFRRANRPGATAQDRQALTQARRFLQEVQANERAVVAQALQEEAAAQAAARRRACARQVRAALDRQYGALGPPYAILMDSLARAVAWAEQVDAEGDPAECAAWDREVRAGVAALQRYTESTREAVLRKRIEEQVVRVVEILEQVILPRAPQLWSEALEAVAARAPRLH